MASWNIPALINKISEDVPAIKALLTALFKWTDADTTDVPVGAKRLQDVVGGKQMQEYSGSAWGNVGKLMHDVDMLDGKHASTAQTADTIPVRDANGTIPGNISGNAATATEASSLASGYTTPVANGGTGATSEAGARASLGADNASNINSGILGIAYGGTGSSTKNFVDLTENQNVGGTKTFSNSPVVTAGVLVKSENMNGIGNADTTRGQRTTRDIGTIYDKDGKYFASVQAEANTDGSRSIYFLMKNRADNGWPMDLKLKELADGTVQTLAKTPPAAANDTQIATTNWVRTASGNTSLNAATATSAGTCTGNAATATKVVATVANDKTGELVRGTMGSNDSFRIAIGGASNAGWAEIATADDYNEPIYVRQYQGDFATLKRTVTLLDASGNSSFPGTITATFKGNITGNVTGNCSGSSGSCTGNAKTATTASSCSGNAATATKLATARNIDAASFNGTANIIVVPIGTILYFAAKTAPSHYLVCNGQAVSRTTYAALFKLIGTTYGAGNGSSTFNVPNLIDRFPQGNATPGTVKAAGIPNIISYFNSQGTLDPDKVGNKSGYADNYVFTTAGLGHVDGGSSNSAKFQTHIKMDLSKGNAIYGKSSTVQPPALTLLPIIKAL